MRDESKPTKYIKKAAVLSTAQRNVLRISPNSRCAQIHHKKFSNSNLYIARSLRRSLCVLISSLYVDAAN